MDWSTILLSLTSSTAVTLAIGYVIKRSFDRALDLRFERLKEQNKALINEEIRRRGALFDKQFPALKASLSLVYRLRNTQRDIIASIEKNDWKEAKKLTSKVQSLLPSAREMLFEERATLPKVFFECLHSLQGNVAIFLSECESVFRMSHEKRQSSRIERIKDLYQRTDEIYLLFAENVQTYIGVSSDDSPHLIEESTDRASLLP